MNHRRQHLQVSYPELLFLDCKADRECSRSTTLMQRSLSFLSRAIHFQHRVRRPTLFSGADTAARWQPQHRKPRRTGSDISSSPSKDTGIVLDCQAFRERPAPTVKTSFIAAPHFQHIVSTSSSIVRHCWPLCFDEISTNDLVQASLVVLEDPACLLNTLLLHFGHGVKGFPDDNRTHIHLCCLPVMNCRQIDSVITVSA